MVSGADLGSRVKKIHRNYYGFNHNPAEVLDEIRYRGTAQAQKRFPDEWAAFNITGIISNGDIRSAQNGYKALRAKAEYLLAAVTSQGFGQMDKSDRDTLAILIRKGTVGKKAVKEAASMFSEKKNVLDSIRRAGLPYAMSSYGEAIENLLQQGVLSKTEINQTHREYWQQTATDLVRQIEKVGVRAVQNYEPDKKDLAEVLRMRVISPHAVKEAERKYMDLLEQRVLKGVMEYGQKCLSRSFVHRLYSTNVEIPWYLKIEETVNYLRSRGKLQDNQVRHVHKLYLADTIAKGLPEFGIKLFEKMYGKKGIAGLIDGGYISQEVIAEGDAKYTTNVPPKIINLIQIIGIDSLRTQPGMFSEREHDKEFLQLEDLLERGVLTQEVITRTDNVYYSNSAAEVLKNITNHGLRYYSYRTSKGWLAYMKAKGRIFDSDIAKAQEAYYAGILPKALELIRKEGFWNVRNRDIVVDLRDAGKLPDEIIASTETGYRDKRKIDFLNAIRKYGVNEANSMIGHSAGELEYLKKNNVFTHTDILLARAQHFLGNLMPKYYKTQNISLLICSPTTWS